MTPIKAGDEVRVFDKSVPDSIAADLSGFGGLLRCTVCQREQSVGDIAGNLRDGWPECHGYTMTWITQRLLDAEATP